MYRPMSKKIDIHTFDAAGRPLASYLHLEKENKRLTAENERLRRMLKAKTLKSEPETKPTVPVILH